MSSTSSPEYYFNGIDFNNNFYPSSTIVLTKTTATSMFLKKITTQSNIAKTFTTIYQNTGTSPIFISISVNTGTVGENFQVFCDSSSSPTTLILNLNGSAYDHLLSFIVLPNYYYKLTHSSTGSIKSWVEWT